PVRRHFPEPDHRRRGDELQLGLRHRKCFAASKHEDLMDEKRHWDHIYDEKAPDRVSWYRPHLERSLRFIEEARLPASAAIIDVGGGASTLVDDLLERGFSNLTVLDLSPKAIRS